MTSQPPALTFSTRICLWPSVYWEVLGFSSKKCSEFGSAAWVFRLWGPGFLAGFKDFRTEKGIVSLCHAFSCTGARSMWLPALQPTETQHQK